MTTPKLIQVGKQRKIHVALSRRGWSIVDNHGKTVANYPTLLACIVKCWDMGYDTRYQQVVS